MLSNRVTGFKVSPTCQALLSLLFATVLAMTACSVIAPKPQPLDLVVLHTNDTYGFTKPAT